MHTSVIKVRSSQFNGFVDTQESIFQVYLDVTTMELTTAPKVDCLWCCRMISSRAFLFALYHIEGSGKQRLSGQRSVTAKNLVIMSFPPPVHNNPGILHLRFERRICQMLPVQPL